MQNNKSILIVGNGPSSSYKAAGKLAKGCEVARTNWFFLEKEQIFGKQVDYLFHTSGNPLINYIYFVLNANDDVYRINNNIEWRNPRILQRLKFILKGCTTKIDLKLWKPRNKVVSHGKITGLNVLKYFLRAGYQTIHIVGMDFYQGEHVYLNTKNAKILELLENNTNYNKGIYLDVQSNHSLAHDINYLSDLLAQYPEVKIIVTSCHPGTTKIWQQFKQVEVMNLSSHQEPEIYDTYLDKQWLQKAVDDCARKYGFRIKLRHRLRKIRLSIKKKRGGRFTLAVIFLIGLVWLANQF